MIFSIRFRIEKRNPMRAVGVSVYLYFYRWIIGTCIWTKKLSGLEKIDVVEISLHLFELYILKRIIFVIFSAYYAWLAVFRSRKMLEGNRWKSSRSSSAGRVIYILYIYFLFNMWIKYLSFYSIQYYFLIYGLCIFRRGQKETTRTVAAKLWHLRCHYYTIKRK